MSAYLLNLITASTADAGNALHNRDAAALDRLTLSCRKFAARKAGRLVDAAEVAQVAALVACPLVLSGRSEDDAARIATHRATVAALRDSGHNETADRLDAAPDTATAEGTPLARLAAPVEIRADRGTSYTDRDRLSLAAASIDPEHVATLRTVLAAPDQQTGPGAGSLSPAALSAAAGKAHSGRQKQTARAALNAATDALKVAYRSTLTATDLPRIRTAWTPDAAALATLLAARADADQRIRRDSMSRGATDSSGPASPVVSTCPRLGMDTPTGYADPASDAATAYRAAVLSLRTIPAHVTNAADRKQESTGFYAPETGTTVSLRPIPGAGRDSKTGEGFAQVGQAGTLTGTGTAPAPKVSGKRKRDGAIGTSMTHA